MRNCLESRVRWKGRALPVAALQAPRSGLHGQRTQTPVPGRVDSAPSVWPKHPSSMNAALEPSPVSCPALREAAQTADSPPAQLSALLCAKRLSQNQQCTREPDQKGEGRHLTESTCGERQSAHRSALPRQQCHMRRNSHKATLCLRLPMSGMLLKGL